MFYDAKRYGYNQVRVKSLSIHAEMSAIKKHYHKNTKAKTKLKKINMLVIKTGFHDNRLTMSKPCHNCLLSMEKLSAKKGLKVNKIYYSDLDGNIIINSLHNLLNEKTHHINGFWY